MKDLSKQLYKIANDLHPYYHDILEVLTELSKIVPPSIKSKFEYTIKVIKEHPEIVDLPHLTFDKQYEMFQRLDTELKVLLQLAANLEQLIPQQTEPKKLRIRDFFDQLHDIQNEIFFFNRAPGDEKPSPDYLGAGISGKVFKENQGYVRKSFKVADRALKNYRWLAKQDHNFYQQVPLVRIYNIEVAEQLSTDPNFYLAKLIMDEVTPYPKYQEKLKLTKEKRWVSFKDKLKLVNYQTLKQLIAEDTERGESFHQLPSGEKLFISDVHSDNFGVYVNQGTEAAPDRLVHIDLDFIEIR